MISILMANYNAEKFIQQAIDSVLKQTNNEWELVIVDDASTDNSFEKIKDNNDKRIKTYKRKENGGYGLTLRDAIKHANGQIYGIFDSDDVLENNAIDIMIKAHKNHPNHGLIYSQFLQCDEQMHPIKKGDCASIPENTTWLDILIHTPKPRPRISHFKTFKKEAYDKTEGFHELRRTVDKDIVLKLEEVTKTLFIDKILYHYRAHPAGISRSKSSKPYGEIVIQNALRRRM